MSANFCTDNRYEVINAAKKKLIECTNIESSPDEMAVIDNILFRMWQIDLITVPDTSTPCPRCGGALSQKLTYHYGGGPIKELARYNGKRYRHCYSCHAEFFLEGENE